MSVAILPPLPVIPNVEARHVPGFLGYAVSSDGKIWSCIKPGHIQPRYREWRPMKPIRVHKKKSPYLFVSLYSDRKPHRFAIHRLILTIFIGEAPKFHEACHNNGLSDDNRLSNLRWDTAKNNQADRRIHGTHLEGEDMPWAKLTEEEVKAIRIFHSKGMPQKDIADLFRMSTAAICFLVNNKSWNHIQR